jgi:hypothetical protein
MSDKPLVKPEPKQYGHEYDLESSVDMLAIDLERKLSETIFERGTTDTRMVEDLRLYHGKYDDKITKALEGAKRSQVFVKLIRAKTNAAEAQLVDLLFPNDDKNYGIKPTPKPELASKLGDTSPVIDPATGKEQQFDDTGEIVTVEHMARRDIEMVQEAADAMLKEIDDQLIECKYNARAREAIHDACVIGTGILKGPVVRGKMDKAFVQETAEDGSVQWVDKQVESFVPVVEVVRPWDFFPDMSASSIEEAEFVFERRYMSKMQIAGLTKSKRFSPERIAKVLKMTGPQTQHTSVYQDDVRRLAGLSDSLNDTRYETWEYHGPVNYQTLVDLGVIELPEGEDERAALLEQMETEILTATVFYCGGVVLGAKLHNLSYENSMPYRVFNWEPDDSSIFGFGVPRMGADEQSIINSVWRMILDNGAITAGPQIIHQKSKVVPEDGDWALSPFKRWNLLNSVDDPRKVFTAVEFNSHLPELQGIYQMARVMLDEVSGVPMLQQGEQGQASQTLGGMSMLMNAANAVRRRQVKAWDDDITTPLISDFYAWNMRYNENPKIKGDFQVDARGTSALLVKETQSQAITAMLQVIGQTPAFAPILEIKAVDIFKQWFRTQNLPMDLMPTQDELEQYKKAQQEQQGNQPQDPAIMVEQMRSEAQKAKFEFEQAMAQQKAQTDMQQAELNNRIKAQQIAVDMQVAASRERVELMKLAQNDKMNNEKLLTELKKSQAKLDQEWQQFVAELQLKQQTNDNEANFGLGQ